MLNNRENKGRGLGKLGLLVMAAVVIVGAVSIVKPGHQSSTRGSHIVKPGHQI